MTLCGDKDELEPHNLSFPLCPSSPEVFVPTCTHRPLFFLLSDSVLLCPDSALVTCWIVRLRLQPISNSDRTGSSGVPLEIRNPSPQVAPFGRCVHTGLFSFHFITLQKTSTGHKTRSCILPRWPQTTSAAGFHLRCHR